MKSMLFHVLVNYSPIIQTAVLRYIIDKLFFFDGGSISRDPVCHD